MNDIFISYSRYDSDKVNELVALLEQEGYSIWIDRDGIESGEDFKRVILKAIKESKVVLFFSSEHSNISDWTAKEIGVAVKYKKHIVPIKLDNSNYNEAVEFDLINLDYIDYSKASIRKAMWGKLLKTLMNKIGNGSKEFERLEAERKAKEEAERARLERERIAKAEAERKAADAKRRAEQECLERERAEAQRRAEVIRANRSMVSDNPQPKPKKRLWIGFGAAVVVTLLLFLLWPKKEEPQPREQPQTQQIASQNTPTVSDGNSDSSSKNNSTGITNGHEWVDLGLPSGTLWATCNVGAIKAEDYGDYYAWGEISTKSIYKWDTYKYAIGDFRKLTKYCNESNYGNNGFTDNLITLQSGDDPVTANWGSGWQAPSKVQWDELLNYTNSTLTMRNGTNGRLFTSKKNRQTIFLPATGGHWHSGLSSVGSRGNYWSRSLYTDYPHFAWGLYFDSDICSCSGSERDVGFSVRPVFQN